VVLIAAAAVLTGSAVLVAARRPSPAIRIFEPPAQAEVVVQVDGAVVRPGLYHLPPGSRVADAIAAAGGPAPTADLALLNRARVLRDGERVTLPHRAAGPPREGQVDLNAAGARELEALPGIGPVLAARIIAYRDRHGPFNRLEDLLQVEGVGPRLLDRLRPRLLIR